MKYDKCCTYIIVMSIITERNVSGLGVVHLFVASLLLKREEPFAFLMGNIPIDVLKFILYEC